MMLSTMMKITQWILRKILTKWMITTMVRRRKEHECTKKLSNLDENCLRRQLAQACEENARLLKSLERIQSMCGNPDPAEACRLILKEAAKAARRGNGLAQA